MRSIKFYKPGIFVVAMLLAIVTAGTAQRPLKVFILAGQSNMVGAGEISKGDMGNLIYLVENDSTGMYSHLKNPNGGWNVRDDVFIYYQRSADDLKTGGLTVGYGGNDNTIGPELEFGNVIGDYYENDVLIIKTAWGGKSLGFDFCPPSAVSDTGYIRTPQAPGDKGYYYVQMLNIVQEVLDNVMQYAPVNRRKQFDIAGFGWHQGWNDRVNQTFVDHYESNMRHFIKDVRRDLEIPELPFVIATTGMTGWEETNTRALALMRAQLAMEDYPEFKSNVKVVDTRDFWREAEVSPSSQGYHWNRNAETYFLIGQSMADSMINILEDTEVEDNDYPTEQIIVPKILPPLGFLEKKKTGKFSHYVENKHIGYIYP